MAQRDRVVLAEGGDSGPPPVLIEKYVRRDGHRLFFHLYIIPLHVFILSPPVFSQQHKRKI